MLAIYVFFPKLSLKNILAVYRDTGYFSNAIYHAAADQGICLMTETSNQSVLQWTPTWCSLIQFNLTLSPWRYSVPRRLPSLPRHTANPRLFYFQLYIRALKPQPCVQQTIRASHRTQRNKFLTLTGLL